MRSSAHITAEGYQKNTRAISLPSAMEGRLASLIDLTGKQFSSWFVIGPAGRKGAHRHWVCRCECGTEREVAGPNLRTGASTNCGCKREFAEKHGHARRGLDGKTRTYRIWKSMLARCHSRYASTKSAYGRWGGRGIEVCTRWRNSYENFLADMGEVPAEHTIEREDNDKGYSPENCRWATRVEQRRNCSRLTFVSHLGADHLVQDAAAAIGVTPSAIFNDHRRNGGSIQDAFDRVASRRGRRSG